MAVLTCILSALRNGQRPFTYEFHKRVAAVQGLYAFWLGGKCLYVGESGNLSQRLYQHRMQEHNAKLKKYFRAYHGDIQVSYCHLPNEENRFLLERAAIRQLRPTANIAHKHS